MSLKSAPTLSLPEMLPKVAKVGPRAFNKHTYLPQPALSLPLLVPTNFSTDYPNQKIGYSGYKGLSNPKTTT